MPTGAPHSSFSGRADFIAALQSLAQVPPDRMRPGAEFAADWIDTPLGPMIAVANQTGLCILEFPERRALPGALRRLLGAHGGLEPRASDVIDQAAHALQLYFSGQDPALEVPLAPQGTPFEHRHWAALRDVAAGGTRSYGAMAERLHTGPRAVGRANGANPVAIVIPCHRLVGADGALTGYGGGLWRKRWLLDFEAKHFTAKKDSP